MRFLLNLLRGKKGGGLGTRGEERAADYVVRELSMKIVARNIRTKGGELDIIALDGQDVVFLEVRTRSSETWGVPEKTIDRKKRGRVIVAARWYIRTRKLHALNPRFDTIAIVWPEVGEPEIRYRRNAFYMNNR